MVRLLLIASSLLLSACGGGSSSGEASNTPNKPNLPPTASEKLKNAKDYSAQELEQAAKSLVTSRFKGSNNNADVDVELAQKTFLYLFNSDETEAPDVVN